MKKSSTEKEASREESHQASRSLMPWRSLEELVPWPGALGELFREGPWGGRERSLLPAMDVSENDEHYAISVELPGTKKDEVHVELHDGMLTIRGEKTSEREEKKEQSRYVERCYGSFSRALRLPSNADADHLDASFKDGVLAITIPKIEEEKPRTISVKAG